MIRDRDDERHDDGRDIGDQQQAACASRQSAPARAAESVDAQCVLGESVGSRLKPARCGSSALLHGELHLCEVGAEEMELLSQLPRTISPDRPTLRRRQPSRCHKGGDGETK